MAHVLKHAYNSSATAGDKINVAIRQSIWTETFIKRRPFVKYGHGGRLDEMVVKSVSGKGDVTSRVWMQHAPLATAEMQDLHLPQ